MPLTHRAGPLLLQHTTYLTMRWLRVPLTAVKQALKRRFPQQHLRYRAYRLLLADPQSFLYTSGWMQSLALGHPADAAGQPVPWMNFQVVQLLAERLRPEMHLFEFGSGFSTAFYAQRVATVCSVEYDLGWAQRVRATAPANVTVIDCPQDVDGAYCRTVARQGRRFDVVVVDGRDRVHCVQQALACLSEAGVIVLDDSQRERYQSAFEQLQAAGFACLSLAGLKPTGNGVDQTSLFYRPGNCLGL